MYILNQFPRKNSLLILILELGMGQIDKLGYPIRSNNIKINKNVNPILI